MHIPVLYYFTPESQEVVFGRTEGLIVLELCQLRFKHPVKTIFLEGFDETFKIPLCVRGRRLGV